jgi:hypothetical protein
MIEVVILGKGARSMLFTLNAPTPYLPFAASSSSCLIETMGMIKISFLIASNPISLAQEGSHKGVKE